MKTKNKWGKALRILMKKSKFGVATLERKGLVGSRQAFYKMESETGNPGVDSIEMIVLGMGCTWHDWADAMDQVGGFVLDGKKRETISRSVATEPIRHSRGRPAKDKGRKSVDVQAEQLDPPKRVRGNP